MAMSIEDFINSIILNKKRNVTTFFSQLERNFSNNDVKEAVLNLNFHSIQGNLERIKKFKELFNDKLENAVTSLFPSEEQRVSLGGIDFVRKSEKISELLREKGNEFFKRRKYDLSLRCFTLAAMYAPKGTKSEALSFSNRSAVFAKKHKWKMFLKDIQRFEEIVKENEIRTGDGTKERVEKQKRQCLDKMSGANDEEASEELTFALNFFKLSKPSKTIPSAEEFIRIKLDPKKGRGLFNIGKNPIEPGTLLILEEPYAHVPHEPFSFNIRNCSACYKDLNGGGIACDGCVFNIYCSEACTASNFHKLHSQFECKIAPYLYEMNVTRVSHLALTILLRLSPEGFKAHLQAETSPVDDPANSEIAGFNKSGIFDSKSYLPMSNQLYHEETVSNTDFFIYSKDAVILTRILDFGTDYFSSLNLENAEAFRAKEMFEKIMVYHILCLGNNRINLEKMAVPTWHSPPGTEISDDNVEIMGTAAFSLASLLNHSCYSNVSWDILPGGKLAVVAVQYIPLGEELLISYGTHYLKSARVERRIELKNKFGFNCECVACKNDWSEDNIVGLYKDWAICPECRKYLGLKMVLKGKLGLGGNLLECVRCRWEISVKELMEKKDFYKGLSLEAFLQVTENNKAVKGLLEATKCVKYYDCFCIMPMSFSQETMKQAFWVIVRKMFG